MLTGLLGPEGLWAGPQGLALGFKTTLLLSSEALLSPPYTPGG